MDRMIELAVTLVGHDKRYVLENMIRAVFFGVRILSEKCGENQIISTRVGDMVTTIMTVDGKTFEGRFAVDEGHPIFKDIETAVKRSFLECVSKYIKPELPWGILIGIRPSKVVENLWIMKLSEKEITDHLLSDAMVAPDKVQLMLKTAEYAQNMRMSATDKSACVYVSIPFCPSRCAYCSFISKTYKKPQIPDEYLDALNMELDCFRDYTYAHKIESVYVGGGTPTTLNAKQLKRLLDLFKDLRVPEYTVEAGRPDTITREKLEILREGGVSRISINPQTLNYKTLERIGRLHTVDMFYKAYEEAKALGFIINTDLIAALPGETPEDFAYSVNEIIKLNPQNITIHTLTIKRAAHLTGQDASLGYANQMLKLAAKRLSEYSPYYIYRQKNTVDNLENVGYTKAGYECAYNIYMMEDITHILSFGAGAVTKLVAGDKISRIRNIKDADEYIKNIDIILNKKKSIKAGNSLCMELL